MSQPNSLTDPRYRAMQAALRTLWLNHPGPLLEGVLEDYPDLAKAVEQERG